MSFDYESTYDWRRTKRWQSLRLTVLNRDNHVCQIRTPKCKGVATTVDHIIPVATAKQLLTPMETNSVSNLRAACTACNYSLGQRVGRTMKTENLAGIKLTASEQRTVDDMVDAAREYQRGEVKRETWYNPKWF